MFGCSARFQTDDVGGHTPWVPGKMPEDAKACWDQSCAEGAGKGSANKVWVVGARVSGDYSCDGGPPVCGDAEVRACADAAGQNCPSRCCQAYGNLCGMVRDCEDEISLSCR